jgi:VWFA-related protein
MSRLPIHVLLAASLTRSVTAAEPEPTPTPVARRAPLVVRVSTELVQVDAVVTDAQGLHVTDLEASDFVLLEDGHPREVTACRYVALPPEAAAPTGAHDDLAPEDVRRALAFVLDDYGLDLEHNKRVHATLTKFVREQMGPGDLVALVRTGQETHVVQPFTNDKGLLETVLADLAHHPAGVRSANPTQGGAPMGRWSAAAGNPNSGGGANGTAFTPLPDPGAEIEAMALRRLIYAQESVRHLAGVVETMSALPGRKAMVFFSNRMSLLDPRPALGTLRGLDAVDGTLTSQLATITALANRLSVVVYAIDPSEGLWTTTGGVPSFRPREKTIDVAGLNPTNGLSRLASDTGGLYLLGGRGDLMPTVQRAIDDQRGYYLIGYVPEASGFQGAPAAAPFRTIAISVKRPGLRVRSRAGYFGVTDEAARAAAATTGGTLTAAAIAPVGAGDLDVWLSARFQQRADDVPLLRCTARVSGGTLKDGQLALDLLGLVLDAQGTVVHELDPARVQVVSANQTRALVQFDAPVPKPGEYQVRLVARDTASRRVGTARERASVGDVRGGRLTLSGLALAQDHQFLMAPTRPGSVIEFGVIAYNARIEAATTKPRLTAHARLLRDGREVAHAAAESVLPEGSALKTHKGAGHFALGGTLLLPDSLDPGRYEVDLSVTDALADKDGTAEVRAPLEIVPATDLLPRP